MDINRKVRLQIAMYFVCCCGNFKKWLNPSDINTKEVNTKKFAMIIEMKSGIRLRKANNKALKPIHKILTLSVLIPENLGLFFE
jgi:hypothetical protein